jgi:transposase
VLRQRATPPTWRGRDRDAGGDPAQLEGDPECAGEIHLPRLRSDQPAIARAWVYVRDDRPFGGPAPPAAVFYYSRDRGGQHPQAHLAGYAGILQADAYGGYGKLYEASRSPGAILEAGCWAHARRKFFVLADVESAARRRAQGKSQAVISPLCLEAVQRIDKLFDIERDINGCSAERRQSAREELSKPIVADLHRWMMDERRKLSSGNDVTKAMDCVAWISERLQPDHLVFPLR